MSLPPGDGQRLRRRPRLPSTSSVRPTSRSRAESIENVPPLSPTVSPPLAPIQSRCSSTPPPSVGWQYPSSCRCLACGKLGCDTCSVKVDAAATRQRLDSLRMNTPYERAKLARSIEELHAEEGRQRQRVLGRYESWLESLRTVELVERHVVRVLQHEAKYREHLCQAEASARAACDLAADRHLLLIALQSTEVAARRSLCAQEQESAAQLARLCAAASQMGRLYLREATTRQALRFNETSQFHRLVATAVEHRRTLAEHRAVRLQFTDAAIHTRAAIAEAWSIGLEDIAAWRAAHLEVLAQHQHQRRVALCAAEHGQHDVAAEEAATRLRIRAEMAEEADYIDECCRIFSRQRAALVKSEVAARLNVCAEAEAGYHAIFLDMQADEDEVHAAEAQRAERQSAALLFAVEALQSVQQEESSAFAALQQRAAEDLSRRYAWAEAKVAARETLWTQCIAERLHGILPDEAQARMALQNALADGEVAVVAWVVSKAQAREDMQQCALASVKEVAAAEHAARFAILSAVAHEEEGVREWCEEKRQIRLQFLQAELGERQACISKEEIAWQLLCGACARAERMLTERAAAYRHSRAKLLQSTEDAVAAVWEEEEETWTRLCAHALQHYARAVDMAAFRTQMEVLQTETRHRTALAQDELMDRSELETKHRWTLCYAAEAAVATLRVQLSGVSTAEAGARQNLYAGVESWYAWAMQQQQEEELRLIAELEKCISAELRSRQQHLIEDARLYDSDESLDFTEEAAVALAAVPWSSSKASEDMHDLRRALVLQALGNPACATPLSASAVDFLVAVVDQAGRRRDAIQEALRAAERMSREAAHRLQQQERYFSAEKEKKEMYDGVATRECEERERRARQAVQDKARGMQSLAAERCRLVDVQAELKEQQRTLEALKSSINKQYSR